jgi:hypothetical protein
MKIILELSVDKNNDYIGLETLGDYKNYLKDSLFEICEDWVIKNQEPNFIFEGVK